MSLATRCTACGTIFRVVQDQLKVSEGWVRCGRCDEIFNAMDGLFDLERDAPREGSATVSAPEQPTVEPEAEPEPEAESSRTDADADVAPEELLAPPGDTAHVEPDAPVDGLDRHEFADARFHADALQEETAQDAGADALAPLGDVVSDLGAQAHTPAPDFVTRAEQAQRWQQPRMRLALSVAALLLAGVFAAQAMHHFRDQAAARWPGSTPALTTWCEWMNCRIEPPRRVEDISVESTSLIHSVAGSDAFKLSVTLRNRGTTPIALPSFDLSLTDAAGQLVARRALSPTDFRAAPLALNAGADATLQLMLSAGNRQVTGYTVEVFYP
jgi:predicted Zn finger-like uncharacterized protein